MDAIFHHQNVDIFSSVTITDLSQKNHFFIILIILLISGAGVGRGPPERRALLQGGSRGARGSAAGAGVPARHPLHRAQLPAALRGGRQEEGRPAAGEALHLHEVE